MRGVDDSRAQRVRLGLVLVAVSNLFAGCDFVDLIQHFENRSKLLPTQQGLRWKYENVYLGQLVDTLVTVIVDEVVLSLKSGHVQATLLSDSLNGFPLRPGTTFAWSNKSDGVYQHGAMTQNGDTLLLDNLVYPYPAEIGATGSLIRYTHQPGADTVWRLLDTLAVELVSKGTAIDTPAGRFDDTYEYVFTVPQDGALTTLDLHRYFVPGVGVVYQVAHSTGHPDRVKEIRTLMERP